MSSSQDAAPSGDSAFSYPPVFQFRPFFTRQPVDETWSKQAAMWRELVLQYCRHHQLSVLTFDGDLVDGPLFRNPAINRGCSSSMVEEIFDDLVQHGHGSWVGSPSSGGGGGGKSASHFGAQLLVRQRPLTEWATSIYRWVTDEGKIGEVFTQVELLEELQQDDASFAELSADELREACDHLEKHERVAAVMRASGRTGALGVKFLRRQ